MRTLHTAAQEIDIAGWFELSKGQCALKTCSGICNSLRSSQPTMERAPIEKIITRSWRVTTLKTCECPEHHRGPPHRHSIVDIKRLLLLFEANTIHWKPLSITGHTDPHIHSHELNTEPATRTQHRERETGFRQYEGKQKSNHDLAAKLCRSLRWPWRHNNKRQQRQGDTDRTYASVELRTSSLDKTPPMLLTRWLAPGFAIITSSNLKLRVCLYLRGARISRCNVQPRNLFVAQEVQNTMWQRVWVASSCELRSAGEPS